MHLEKTTSVILLTALAIMSAGCGNKESKAGSDISSQEVESSDLSGVPGGGKCLLRRKTTEKG